MRTNQLLDQNEIWITADRMPVKLIEMDASHRSATLAWLRRRPGYLRRAYDWCELDDLERGGVHFDMDPLALTDEHRAWLERRPLVVELARLVEIDRRGPIIEAEWFADADRHLDEDIQISPRRARALAAATLPLSIED